jgi:hypothetical protein
MAYSKLKHNTKLPENYHNAFLKEVCVTMSNTKKDNLKKLNKKQVLFSRKHYLNKRFDYSNDAVLSFEILSSKLTAMQADIIAKYNLLTKKIDAELISNGGQFTDYNIKINIQFFCNTIDDNIDVLFESEQILCGDFDNDHTLELVNKNYADYECLNEYKKRFSHFHQSRIFHHLLMESHLALQDILLLDEIWFDIKVDYQTINSLK